KLKCLQGAKKRCKCRDAARIIENTALFGRGISFFAATDNRHNSSQVAHWPRFNLVRRREWIIELRSNENQPLAIGHWYLSNPPRTNLSYKRDSGKVLEKARDLCPGLGPKLRLCSGTVPTQPQSARRRQRTAGRAQKSFSKNSVGGRYLATFSSNYFGGVHPL